MYFVSSFWSYLQNGTVSQLTFWFWISVILRNFTPVFSDTAVVVKPYWGLSHTSFNLFTSQSSGISPISVFLSFLFWNLEFGICLELEIWDLEFLKLGAPYLNKSTITDFFNSFVVSIIFSCTSIASWIVSKILTIFCWIFISSGKEISKSKISSSLTDG